MADPPEEGFLPPEPPGPEPEIGKAPSPPEQELPPHSPPPAAWQQPQAGGWQQGGWQQPPTAGQPPPPGQPPPGQAPPPAGQPPAGQPPAGQPPYGGWQQQPWQQPPPPGWQQPQWAYPREPENNPAVTGFVLAMISAGLWVISAGLSSLISLGLAIAGLIVSRKGKRKVSSGETTRHKGLAQAGFISSIVMIALAALSTIGWGVFFVLLATSEDFRDDFDDNNDDNDPFNSDSIRAAVVVLRLGAKLLS